MILDVVVVAVCRNEGYGTAAAAAAAGRSSSRRRRRGESGSDGRTRLQRRSRTRQSGRRDGRVDRLGIAKDALVFGAGGQVGQRADCQLNLVGFGCLFFRTELK